MCETTKTFGQTLLEKIDVVELLDTNLSLLKGAGFLPKQIGLGETFYNQLKEQFCSKHNILDKTEIELKNYKNIPLTVFEDNRMSGNVVQRYSLPFVIAYDLPEEPSEAAGQ